MSNFKIMYIAEIKKIIAKKSVWIALTAGLALVLLVGLTNLSADGNRASVKYQEEILSETTGQKLNQELLDNFQKDLENEIQTNGDLYEKINSYDPGAVYMNASSAVGQKALYDLLYNIVRDKDKVKSVTESELYIAMKEDFLKDGRELGASEEELNKWSRSFDSIEKPITYSYALAYLNILDVLFIISWVLILNISVAISGVFADEKTNRMDALIMSSKKGRSPICLAKILAGITISLLQAVVLMGGVFIVMFLFYGTTGWSAMIQNVIPSSPWNITIGQMILIYILLAVFISIFFAISNMFLSQFTHSAMITMAIHAALIFICLFNMPAKLGLISKLWQLRPTMALYYGTFCNTFRYGVFNNVQISVILYVTAALVLAVGLILLYRKSQVESR